MMQTADHGISITLPMCGASTGRGIGLS